MLITVEPKLGVDTLLCPKFIVFDLCNHISAQGKLLILNFSLFGGFTGLEGGGGGGGGGGGLSAKCPNCDYNLASEHNIQYVIFGAF